MTFIYKKKNNGNELKVEYVLSSESKGWVGENLTKNNPYI